MGGCFGRFYDSDELRSYGFKSVGANVLVHERANVFGVDAISLGDNVRIDAFVNMVVSGGGEIRVGSFVHIGSFVNIAGSGGVTIGDFAGLSQGVKVYSASDDFSGEFLTGPTVPKAFTNPTVAPVRIGRHAILGSCSVVLPGVSIGDGVSVGALSLVNESLAPWGVYVGVPARRLRDRSKRLLDLERQLQATR